MSIGRGKYDPECVQALQQTGAQLAGLIVLHGQAGNGFSVATRSPHYLAAMPEILRAMADEIERDLAKGAAQMNEGKIYRIERHESGVTCTVETVEGQYALPHRVFHSPTGFEVGYGGSGPADLALSIAADHLGVPPDFDFRTMPIDCEDARAREAWALHQHVKATLLAHPETRDGLRLTSLQIDALAELRRQERARGETPDAQG